MTRSERLALRALRDCGAIAFPASGWPTDAMKSLYRMRAATWSTEELRGVRWHLMRLTDHGRALARALRAYEEDLTCD
jgi:hypothetical protein